MPLSPSSSGSVATGAAAVDSGGAGEDGDGKPDEGNSNGGVGGASSLLEDLMGGLSLTGFGASEPNDAVGLKRVARNTDSLTGSEQCCTDYGCATFGHCRRWFASVRCFPAEYPLFLALHRPWM